MKVLHVLNELRASGAEVMLKVAAERWRAHGISGHIVSIDRSVGEYADELRRSGYTIHHIPMTKGPSLPRSTWQLAALVRRENFDVVHLHTERLHALHAIAARLGGAGTLVRTVHNVFEFEGVERAGRWAQRWVARRLGVVFVAIGPSVATNERERYGNETRVIPNWFDPRFATPYDDERRRADREALGLDDRLVLISVGNCGYAKNHEAILAAVARLARERRVTYLHVGAEKPDGDERTLARDLGLDEDAVRFLGFTTDVLPLLRIADVFVMPSKFEGLGNAALEALAAGLPCVLSDVAGLRDLASFTSHVAWCGTDADSVAEAVATIARDGGESMRAMGRAASADVAEVGSVAVGADAYASLYRDDLRTTRRAFSS